MDRRLGTIEYSFSFSKCQYFLFIDFTKSSIFSSLRESKKKIKSGSSEAVHDRWKIIFRLQMFEDK